MNMDEDEKKLWREEQLEVIRSEKARDEEILFLQEIDVELGMVFHYRVVKRSLLGNEDVTYYFYKIRYASFSGKRTWEHIIGSGYWENDTHG